MIRIILLLASLAWPVTRSHQELIDLAGRKGDVTHLYDLYAKAPQASILTYGAKSDGVTCDTAAVNAAIAAVGSAGARGVVIFPAGVTRLNITVDSRPVFFKGQNNGGTILSPCVDSLPIIKVDNSTSVTAYMFADLRFNGEGSRGDGITLRNTVLSSLIRCYFSTLRYGVDIGNNSTLINVFDCVFGSSDSIGLRLSSSGTDSHNRIIGNWFDENISRGMLVNSSRNVIANNNFLDNTGIHLLLEASAKKNLVIGNIFQRGGAPYTTGIGIRAYGDSNTIALNEFDPHTTNTIRLESGARGNVVKWNGGTVGTMADLDTNQIIHDRFCEGSGSPAGRYGPPCMVYLRTDGIADSMIYVRETGSGTSGWVAK
jgi:hypothetical protein